MDRPPRPPQSGLLDGSSARFIAATGAFKGAVGIGLLVFLPLAGYALLATQTVIFLYESIGKLVSTYPSRQNVRGRPVNFVLHGSILGGIVLQMLTVAIPGLRRFLGLSMLDVRSVGVLVVAVLATWCVAALTSRLIGHTRRPSPPRGHALARDFALEGSE